MSAKTCLSRIDRGGATRFGIKELDVYGFETIGDKPFHKFAVTLNL